MVDAERAEARIARLEELIERLETVRGKGVDAYLGDVELRAMTERWLEVALQVCIDLGTQVVMEQSAPAPSSYAEIFETLGRNGLLSEELRPPPGRRGPAAQPCRPPIMEVDDRAVFASLAFLDAICVNSPPSPSRPARLSFPIRPAVYIPNFNGAERIGRALRSLREQTRAIDVVVVDNGSSDHSLALLRDEFPEVTLLALGENLGFGPALNRAVAEHPADPLILLNNDAECRAALRRGAARRPAEGVESVAGVMLQERAPELIDSAGVVADRTLMGFDYLHGEPVEVRAARRRPARADRGRRPLRRAAFEAVGGFDERIFLYYEDLDLALRMRAAGARCRLAAGRERCTPTRPASAPPAARSTPAPAGAAATCCAATGSCRDRATPLRALACEGAICAGQLLRDRTAKGIWAGCAAGVRGRAGAAGAGPGRPARDQRPRGPRAAPAAPRLAERAEDGRCYGSTSFSPAAPAVIRTRKLLEPRQGLGRRVNLPVRLLGPLNKVLGVPIALGLTADNPMPGGTSYEIGHLDKRVQCAVLMNGAADDPLRAPHDIWLAFRERVVEAMGNEDPAALNEASSPSMTVSGSFGRGAVPTNSAYAIQNQRR